MSFLEELNTLFGIQGLYEILGVEKTATEAEIKKAYRRLSLKVHPDRVGDEQKDLATQKFQAISKIHSILSNKDLRGIYDETGEVGEEMVEQERDWMYYWRVLFPKITTEDIKKFEKEYKGSDEEVKDLKSAYVQCEGNMEGILENVMCATEDDEARFRKILQNAIDTDELPAFDNFTKEDKKKKRARKQKVWVWWKFQLSKFKYFCLCKYLPTMQKSFNKIKFPFCLMMALPREHKNSFSNYKNHINLLWQLQSAKANFES